MRIASLTAVPLAAGAIILLASGCGGPAAAAPASPTPAPAVHDGKHDGKKAGHGVRGTVTAENGTTWTVTTEKNRTVTVTLTPQTAFGTKKAPATVAQFPVGSPVRVAGDRHDDAITATRISAPVHKDPAAPASPTAGA